MDCKAAPLTVFKFLTGFIYDKFGLRFATITCSMAAIVAMVSLVLLNSGDGGKVFAMIYGIIASLALPLETVMIPIVVGDLFGEKSFNKILGIFVTVNAAGFSLGSPVMNFVYDAFGSYNIAFIGCSVLMAMVIVIMQTSITKGYKIRKAVLESQKETELQNV